MTVKKNIEERLPQRALTAHKGQCGRVGILAGSLAMPGAAILTAKAAFRSGAGMVYLAAPQSVLDLVIPMVPEVIGVALTKTNTIQHIVKASQLYKWDSFIVGPGLGATDSTSIQNYLTLVQKIHEAGIPTVIDADALPIIHNLVLNKKMAIVTPHEGEFTRLFGPIENRLSDACKASQKIQQTIILKGHKTVISDAQGYSINTTGNPSMATAGSGDVLSGIIGGLWAQYPKEERQTKSWEVAAISTWLHGKAGDIAFQKKDRGLMASDITESLGAAFLYAKEAYLAYHHV